MNANDVVDVHLLTDFLRRAAMFSLLMWKDYKAPTMTTGVDYKVRNAL